MGSFLTARYIAIMGKRRGAEPMPSQLYARAAFAALLWWQFADHSTQAPRLACIEAAIHGPGYPSGALAAQQILTAIGQIPPSHIVVRPWANATITEVRGYRVLLRASARRQPGISAPGAVLTQDAEVVVITHPYHVRRTRSYFAEIGLWPTVLGVTGAMAAQIQPQGLAPTWRAQLLALVEQGTPSGLGQGREWLVEWLMFHLHQRDPRGRVERWLAKNIRGGRL